MEQQNQKQNNDAFWMATQAQRMAEQSMTWWLQYWTTVLNIWWGKR